MLPRATPRYSLIGFLIGILSFSYLSTHPDTATETHSQFELLNSNFSIPSGYRLDLLPNDPFYTNAGNVKTDFQRWIFDGIKNNRNLNAQTAWDLTTGRPDVVIAVVDSGVLVTHPDLKDNLWRNEKEIPGNGLDDDGNGFVDDVQGWDFVGNSANVNPDLGDGLDNDGNSLADENTYHGTFLAGLIAAKGNNGTGIAGTTWNCRFMPLKVVGADGTAAETEVVRAIRYAVANGASVINLSFSGLTAGADIRAAIAFALERNVVVVASAGDENSPSPRFPARLPGVISVGATASGFTNAPRDFNGSKINGRAAFTTFGPEAVDVVAPGFALSTGVLSVFDERAGEGKAGTAVYTFASGTSVSTALVSGLAALVISRGRDLGLSLTVEQVRNIIFSTTVQLFDDPDDKPDAGSAWAGRGRVEFVNALNAVASLGNTPLIRKVTYAAGQMQLTLTGDNFPVATSVVALNGTELPQRNLRFAKVSSGLARKITVANVGESLFPVGERIQITVRNGRDGKVSPPYTYVRK
ncbi:MAG: S8 family serine peptidase [Blastocatellia bacterium]|nr:S8 family serine peptidase [Blastocatellia bacterium]